MDRKKILLIIIAFVVLGISSFYILIRDDKTDEMTASDNAYIIDTKNDTSIENSVEPIQEDKEEKIPIIFKNDPEKQREAEEAAEKEPALKEFFMGYPDNDGSVTGGFTKEEIEAEHPHFLQYDTRWGYHKYGLNCIGFSGCAPTAMAIVALQLTKNPENTPDVIADYAMEQGMYIENNGTSWNFFVQCDEHFGVKGSILPFSEQKMKEELDKGHPIIISLAPGDFTKNGHIAVVVDYDEEGFIISDPGSTIRSQKSWPFDVLIPQVKQLWVYTNLYG